MRKPAKSLYGELCTKRSPYLERARKCAELTIPSVMPPAKTSGSSDIIVPYQSVGARGVNTLAAKLLMSLIPPNQAFFRMLVDDFELAEKFDEEGRADFEEALSDVERSIMTEIERRAIRTPAFTAFRQLLISGNSLFYMPKDKKPRAIRLDSYVVRRSPDGTVLDVIIEEEIAYGALPEDIRKKIDEDPEGKKYEADDVVEVYTHFYLDGKKYRGYQECGGHKIDGSEGTWNIKRPPFIALRWTHMDGEHYGRSHVEEYIGDLNSLEGLSQAILETSKAAAKAIIMVRPNSSLRPQKLAEAKNLDVIVGEEGDATILQLEKRADLQVAQAQANELKQRLAEAFLLGSAIQRDAERVTAEEIRIMAGELEESLGGVYSLLSQEFQLPLVFRVMDAMQREKRIPTLPEGIEPSIVTGLEALGRGHDLSKMQVFSNEVAKFGPETIDEYLNLGDYFKRFGVGLGIDMDGLVRTQEERDQREAQRQQQIEQQQAAEMAGKAIGPAIAAQAKEQGA